MSLPDATRSDRVYPLLQNIDLENLAFATIQGVGETLNIEEMNEDELRRLVLVNLARLTVAGEWNGLLTAAGGAETLGELTDVSLDITNFVDSLLIQPDSNGSAPTTGTLSGVANSIGIGGQTFQALTSGVNNVGYGHQSLEDITSGSYCTAVGHRSLRKMTTVNDNTGVGSYAGEGIGNGGNNTAIGAQCLRADQDSASNTGVGSNALRLANGGNSNTAVGHLALYNVLSSHYNTAVGKGAGYLATGASNIFLGHEAGETVTSGANNVVIGGVAVASATADDQLVISAGDGGMFWIKGDSGGACYQGDNASAWSTTSDRRLKREVADSTTGLEAIKAIQVRNYRFRVDNPYQLDPEPVRVGVIAQELEEVFPEAVEENLHGHKTVNTDRINWALLKAVQELSAKVEALENPE